MVYLVVVRPEIFHVFFLKSVPHTANNLWVCEISMMAQENEDQKQSHLD